MINCLMGSLSDAWEPFIRDHLPREEDALECFLVSLGFTIEALRSGSDGVSEALVALQSAFEQAYLFTNEHRAALHLYQLSRAGNTTQADEPIELLRPAIERSQPERSQPEKAKTARRRAKGATTEKRKPGRRGKGRRKKGIAA